ncbi:MAG TPA: patatin-like phospholipase family protein [Caulobacteraceae bacterium]
MVLASLALLSACETPSRLSAVPYELTAQAVPAEGPLRFWPDEDPKPLIAEVEAAREREQRYRAAAGLTGPLPPSDFLAISGGGDDGAFGAGLLVGWTQAGNRPEFRMVTGVSTGALIAPLAFLGPKYDDDLRKFYTTVTAKDIFRRRNIIEGVLTDALYDTRPLARYIDRVVTRELLDQIAAEYAKGRSLFIGTTDLDVRRGAIWNMGAIAASHDPNALALFRKVMLASASIPGLFPPVMIDVTVNGKRYQEMHVDGGATNQVFMYPETLPLGELVPDLTDPRERKVYVIRNARLDSGWASVDRRTLKVIGRSVDALIHNQALGDLARIYITANRDHIDYNLAFIPKDFDVTKEGAFRPDYMRPLFERGYEMGKSGYPWMKVPPGLVGPVDPTDRATVQ